MALYYLKPVWFSGTDIIFELAFAIIAFLVATYAFKIFHFSKNKDAKWLGIGFLLLGGAYVALSISNFTILTNIAGKQIVPFSTVTSLVNLNYLSLYIYLFLYFSGLAFFSRTILKDKSGKSFLLVYFPGLIALILSQNKLLLFHILTLVILSIVVIHYYEKYTRKRNPKTLMTFLAFSILFVGRLHYAFTLNHGMFYTLGHFFELIAYLFILFGLLQVVRK